MRILDTSEQRRRQNTKGNEMATTTMITGNTYPVKDALRALGGRWDAVAKGWKVPAAMAQKAQALVSGSASSKPPMNAGYVKYQAAQRFVVRATGRNGCGYPGCDGRHFCDECSE